VTIVADAAQAQTIGQVDFDGKELGLIGSTHSIYSYTGPDFGTDATLLDPGLGWPNVGPNGVGMPFSISDDSVAPAAGLFTARQGSGPGDSGPGPL
jgi:hypothetical protein